MFPLSEKDEVCVAITGGAGQIAYALVPLMVDGRVFGEGRKVRLRLLDIEACAGALEGVAMEVVDCYSELVTEVVTTCDPEVVFEGADVAVLLGGFPRLPGMERRDLIAKNVPIMAEHGRALAKCASDGVRVLVVANPACTNCLIASISAPSIPRSHFSSLARLDQDRMSAMLADEVSSEAAAAASSGHQHHQEPINLAATRVAVRGAYLWGNHSPTMWPDVSRAEVKAGGRWVPIEDEAVTKRGGIRDSVGATAAELDAATAAWSEWVRETLVPAVRERGTRVIEARGKSSALSAANAIANHLRDWLLRPSGASGGVSMGVFSDGNPYGVPDGLFFSFPVECGEGRHRILAGFQPDDAMLEASARELLDERREALETLRESGSYASQVVKAGASAASTSVVLMPEDKACGTPSAFLELTLNALSNHVDDNHVGRTKMTKNINALLGVDGQNWPASLGVCSWDQTWGPAPRSFVNSKPHMVAIQGQHRLAAMTAGFAEELGLSMDRVGDLGPDGLFPPRGDVDDPVKDSREQMETFRAQLQTHQIQATVYDFLSTDKALEVGHQQRGAETYTTKHGMHDCIVMWKSLIQQVANRDKQIMDPAMAEAQLGKQWRDNDNAATKATFEKVREKVATELTRIGITSSGQPIVTLVYAAALCSERFIINFLVEHFKDQDDKLQHHNAAAALAHRLPENGKQMHLSTSSSPIPWTLRVWAEWLHYVHPKPELERKAKKQRHVAAFAALLLVDHFLAVRSGGSSRLDCFKKLVDVFFEEAAALTLNPTELQLPGGHPLLNEERVAYLRKTRGMSATDALSAATPQNSASSPPSAPVPASTPAPPPPAAGPEAAGPRATSPAPATAKTPDSGEATCREPELFLDILAHDEDGVEVVLHGMKLNQSQAGGVRDLIETGELEAGVAVACKIIARVVGKRGALAKARASCSGGGRIGPGVEKSATARAGRSVNPVTHSPTWARLGTGYAAPRSSSDLSYSSPSDDSDPSSAGKDPSASSADDSDDDDVLERASGAKRGRGRKAPQPHPSKNVPKKAKSGTTSTHAPEASSDSGVKRGSHQKASTARPRSSKGTPKAGKEAPRGTSVAPNAESESGSGAKRGRGKKTCNPVSQSPENRPTAKKPKSSTSSATAAAVEPNSGEDSDCAWEPGNKSNDPLSDDSDASRSSSDAAGEGGQPSPRTRTAKRRHQNAATAASGHKKARLETAELMSAAGGKSNVLPKSFDTTRNYAHENFLDKRRLPPPCKGKSLNKHGVQSPKPADWPRSLPKLGPSKGGASSSDGMPTASRGTDSFIGEIDVAAGFSSGLVAPPEALAAAEPEAKDVGDDGGGNSAAEPQPAIPVHVAISITDGGTDAIEFGTEPVTPEVLSQRPRLKPGMQVVQLTITGGRVQMDGQEHNKFSAVHDEVARSVPTIRSVAVTSVSKGDASGVIDALIPQEPSRWRVAPNLVSLLLSDLTGGDGTTASGAHPVRMIGQAIKVFNQLPALQELVLLNCQAREADLEPLAAALEKGNAPQLRVFRCGNDQQRWGSPESSANLLLKALACGARPRHRLKVLNITNCWGFVDTSLTYLRAALRACPDLCQLSIDSSKRPVLEVLDLAYAIAAGHLPQLETVRLIVPAVVNPKDDPTKAIQVLASVAENKLPPAALDVKLA
eukprot:g3508.t2